MELTIATTPSPAPTPTLTRDTNVDKDDIIPIEEDCFLFLSDGVRRRGRSGGTEHGSATSKSKSRAVGKIGQAITQYQLSEKQIVLALRDASTHADMRKFLQALG